MGYASQHLLHIKTRHRTAPAHPTFKMARDRTLGLHAASLFIPTSRWHACRAAPRKPPRTSRKPEPYLPRSQTMCEWTLPIQRYLGNVDSSANSVRSLGEAVAQLGQIHRHLACCHERLSLSFHHGTYCPQKLLLVGGHASFMRVSNTFVCIDMCLRRRLQVTTEFFRSHIKAYKPCDISSSKATHCHVTKVL